MDVLVTVRHPDGYTVAHAVDWVSPMEALLSPNIQWLRQAERLVGLPFWQRPRCLVPTGGVHLDTETRTVYAWQAATVWRAKRKLKQATHGWRTIWWGDRYEAHLAVTATTVAWRPRDVIDLEKMIRARFRTGRDLVVAKESAQRSREPEPTRNPRKQARQLRQVVASLPRHRSLDHANRQASRY
jgi:hypothetical protein